jgi:thiol-disulfide isomerase/thioredoxin
MLKVGGHYELIARAKEGGDLISQKVIVKPPKANLLMQLDKRFTTSSTPPLPDAPSAEPGKKRSSSEGSSDRSSNVIIEPPVRLPSEEQPSGGMGTSPASDNGSGAGSGGVNPPNPANIAEGFRRAPMSQPATIPNVQDRNPWPPPLPSHSQWENVPDSRPSQPPGVPQSPGSVRLPNMPTPVPSCGLYGNRLDNFALKDVEGKVWEYRRDRRGRLVLLDFWYHTCGPCLTEIPHLNALQNDYGPYGLEVVSIACETGPLAEQQKNVRTIRARHYINYKTLLSGGGPGKCPVMEQFGATYFPMLVLLDNDGTILWQSTREGMDKYARDNLRKMIHDRLVQQR